jgi:hypothetical protein
MTWSGLGAGLYFVLHDLLRAAAQAACYARCKMRLTVGFTYVVIIGVIITLVGQVLYLFTHSFTLVIGQPKLHYFAFGILSSFVFYRIGSGLQPQSAKKVWYSLSIAAAFKSVSYLVNSYFSDQAVLGLFFYLSVVGA